LRYLHHEYPKVFQKPSEVKSDTKVCVHS
jgi:hypothetical protein